SPVNGRPVRFAPRRPGARPTIRSRASRRPNEATGALNQSGSRRRQSSRNAFRRGQRGQSRPGLPDASDIGSVFEVVVVNRGAGACPLWRSGSLQELRRVTLARFAGFARGAFGRVPAEIGLQLRGGE